MAVLFIVAVVVAIIFAVANFVARLDRDSYRERWQKLHWERMSERMNRESCINVGLDLARKHKYEIRRIHQEHGTELRKLNQEILRLEGR